MKAQRLGWVGFGEVGQIFAQGLQGQVSSMAMWDIALNGPPSRANALRERAQALGMTVCESATELAQMSDGIISAVTASNTLQVAQELSAQALNGAWVLDLNSASPGTKQACERSIRAAGGVYVEAGVMTSVPPYGIRVPMLLGGAQAAELAQLLNQWGCDAKAIATEVGVASATKMSRSIMIKGLEALVIESFTTARAYGVEDRMLATLAETFPQIDWPKQGAYFFSRVAQHGKRRAEEMRESARTVAETGVEPLMTQAIAPKHDWVAQLARDGVFDDVGPQSPWQDWADALIRKTGGK